MTLTRRDFLKMSGLFAAWSALSSCAPAAQTTAVPTVLPTATTVPTVMPAEDAFLIHALKRITFGATPEMIEKAKRIGIEDFIEEQLNPESLPDENIDDLLRQFSTLTMTPAERFQLDKKGEPVQELIAATLLRQWHSERQLFEMMVNFWSNHFSIFIGKNLCRILKTDDDLNAIRPNALKKFRDLLSASAHSPAMLVFLDQAESRGESPNENYARELLELHTVGVDAGYSQDDIANLARALTGWTILGPRNQRSNPGTFAFNPKIHEGSEKHVMGLTIPPGGEEEGTQILDMLAGHASTAHFISRKLARRFVSDSPTPELVDMLASVFLQSDGDVRELLRALFTSDAFKSSAGQKFKTPLEFFISALRLTGTTVKRNTRGLLEHLRLLGQVPFTWPPPNGFPDVGGFWATTSGLLDRWNFGLLLTSNQIKGAEVDLKSLTNDASSPQDIVDVLSLRFLGARLPEDGRSILLDFASSGTLDENIPSIAGLILGSPHFQMR
jgi:uncharacterized protein (DUF1800 family)